MTRFTGVESVIVKFKNREGIDEAIEIKEFGEGSYAEIEVTDDGKFADFMVYSPDMNNGSGYGFRTLDDWDIRLVRRSDDAAAKPESETRERAKFGPVGNAIMTIITLAIITPFVGLLWHWAVGVIQR